MRRPSLLLAAVVALGGCSLSLDTDELDPLATAEGFCQTLLDAMLSGPCGATTEEFAAAEHEARLPMCAALGRSDVEYRRDLGEACISGLRSSSCAGREGALEACEGALVGDVSDGGPCVDTVQCGNPEARCLNLDLSCPGACIPPGREGDPCANGYPDCADGNYCDGATQRCVRADPQGTLCATGAVQCGNGSYCDALAGCQPYAAEGEPCDDARPCDWSESLFCDKNNFTPPAATPTCKPYGSLPVGATCEWGGQCVWEAYCDTASYRCVERRGEGADCSGDERCMPPLACLGDSTTAGEGDGTCGPRRSPGEPCAPDSYDCLWGAGCVGPAGSAVCEAWPAQHDAPCAPGWDRGCLVGRCVGDSTSSSYTCEAFADLGEPCNGDRDCGPLGRCDYRPGTTDAVCADACY